MNLKLQTAHRDIYSHSSTTLYRRDYVELILFVIHILIIFTAGKYIHEAMGVASIIGFVVQKKLSVRLKLMMFTLQYDALLHQKKLKNKKLSW